MKDEKYVAMSFGNILAVVLVSMILGAFIHDQFNSPPITDAESGTALDRDVRTFNVSAYDACDECCGDWNDGTYADGTPVGGLVVAAPTDIPFGTEIEIPGYGVATVRDRGGAITEGCLDLYFDTHQEALNFGRHDIECEVLK